jgi:RNA polymerase sigma-70 factor (ECF subfamily)
MKNRHSAPGVEKKLARDLDDRQLVEKILAGDKEAERFFFHAYRDRLFNACVYILGRDEREAEDIVQETFIAAFKGLKTFEFRSSLSHWLVRICVNRCHEKLRQRQKQIVRFQKELEQLSGPSSIQKDKHQEEDAEHHQLLQVIETQRGHLGKPCQELLKLRDSEEKSYAKIAQALKVPIGTVMSRLARCKETLKKLVTRALREGIHA